jgi:hypothetical protein
LSTDLGHSPQDRLPHSLQARGAKQRVAIRYRLVGPVTNSRICFVEGAQELSWSSVNLTATLAATALGFKVGSELPEDSLEFDVRWCDILMRRRSRTFEVERWAFCGPSKCHQTFVSTRGTHAFEMAAWSKVDALVRAVRRASETA